MSESPTCGNGCTCLTQCGDTYEHAGLPKPPARGMEAAEAGETEGLDPKGDSPVPKARAQEQEREAGATSGAPETAPAEAAAWDFRLWQRELLRLVGELQGCSTYAWPRHYAAVVAHAENVGMHWRARAFLAERAGASGAAEPLMDAATKALEFAEYMATSAEFLIKSYCDLCTAEATAEDAEDEVQQTHAAVQVERAQECMSDALRGMRDRIYEFRRRAILAAPKREAEPSQGGAD